MNCFGGFNILTNIIMNVITSILYTNPQPDLSGALFCHCDCRNIQFIPLTLFAMSKKAGTEGGQAAQILVTLIYKCQFVRIFHWIFFRKASETVIWRA